MPRYRLIQKTFQYEELGKSFRVAEGDIISVVQSTIESDLSMTLILLIREG